jgi:hypothetical protein
MNAASSEITVLNGESAQRDREQKLTIAATCFRRERIQA